MPFLPVRVAWEFFDRAFLRLGFLDGTAGLTFAALSSANTLLKYLKLRELERAIARGERLPPANARADDTAVLEAPGAPQVPRMNAAARLGAARPRRGRARRSRSASPGGARSARARRSSCTTRSGRTGPARA